MAIPDDIAAEILSQCGRCCCLCRRFLPIRLQVHHIAERCQGGTDDPDNLIALCLTCHTDVHTTAPFTRRFSAEELKLHRNRVYELVAQGNLPAGDRYNETPQEFEEIISLILMRLATMPASEAKPSLLKAAAEILLKAAKDDGRVIFLRHMGGTEIQAAGDALNKAEDPRSVAEYIAALEQLENLELLRAANYKRQVFYVTHEGYLLADQLFTSFAQVEIL